MQYSIKHALPGRIRFQFGSRLSEHEAVALEEILQELYVVTKVTAYPLAASVAVEFDATQEAREEVTERIALLTRDDLESWAPSDPMMLAPRPRQLFSRIANETFWFAVRLFVLPRPVSAVWWFFKAIPFWREGLRSLRQRKLDVPVLDAAAIALGFTQGASNAGETMYLLGIGETLEDYTQKRAMTSLARSLLELPTTAWLVEGVNETEVDLAQLKPGDTIVARMGLAIPVDGEVIRGEAMVNQASLTGEPLAIVRQAGDSVYAGTAVEEGELFIRVKGNPLESKIHSIITMVEEPDVDKSPGQRRMERLANKLVPWNFALAAGVALFTRSITKTASVLMVDYSCALRMSGAIAVMAAQRDGARDGFMVRGSRYFEEMHGADTIIFDKTGTLTNALPQVSHVEPFDGYTREDALRLAACLEEHFPHPVARAVVQAALDEGLEHRECHAAVEYIVAHGIASSLDGKRVVIGSQHFVLEDEGVTVSKAQLERIRELSPGSSLLFLAVDHELRGVICIDDPIRDNAASIVSQLRDEGFGRIIMLTGDEGRAAGRIAMQAGIDEYQAGLLPEEKLQIVRELQAQGHTVCMVGDGVNDSPALMAADVSIAMSAGSAIAREAADISLVSNDLESIVRLKRLSRELDARMGHGYRFTIAFNSALLALGIAGVLTPHQSAFLHNGSTIALSAANSRQYGQGPETSQDVGPQ